MTPSHYQQAILTWITSGTGHAAVDAVAGSGKTTSLMQAANALPPGSDACVLAFNGHIAKELGARLQAAGSSTRASTVHALGRRRLADTLDPHLDVKEQKYSWLAKDYLAENSVLWKGAAYPDEYSGRRALVELVNCARLALLDPSDPADFRAACDGWGLTCPDGWARAVADLLKRGALRAQKTGMIDFTDMLYLPVRWGLKSEWPLDWLLCDEVQDFSAAQRELILLHTDEHSRGLWVGDARQAIMGFAFAEYDSWSQVSARLNATHLPLSICYRCPPNHLDLVRDIVPQIEAVEGREPGLLDWLDGPQAVPELAQPGDMILCRRTAPLIRLAARLIAAGIGARIRGRDYGASLEALLRECSGGGHNLPKIALARGVQEWWAKQVSLAEARSAGRGVFERIDGQREVLEAIIDSAPGPDLNACLEYLHRLFDESTGQVWLSSIHRAKGLEAERVFVLEADQLGRGFPRQSEAELLQEQNLRYVGLTRSRSALYLCPTPKGGN